MSPNLLVRIAAVAVLAVVVALIVVRCSRDEAPGVGTAPVVGGEALAPETAAALGIRGRHPRRHGANADCERGARRTRVSRGWKTRTAPCATTTRAFGILRASVVAEVTGSLAGEAARLREENRGVVADAREEVSGLRAEIARLVGAAPIGGAQRPRATGTVWLAPLEVDAPGSGLLPWGEGPAGAVPLKADAAEAAPAPVRPVYTIPKNATLVGARAFTALIGRVPVGEDARVTDPYFFKVIVGRDNLAANGHEIPELAYAVASGEAIGDWTLGCVSGDVTSLTFVFADGRIVTVPEARDVSDGGTGTRAVRLGGLSDDHGNPCVAGERITNAAAHLGQSAAVLTLGAAAEGLAAAQTTTVAGGAGGTQSVVDGDLGRYVAGHGLAGAAREVARWLRERQAQSYDAVYVPPGARVAVHVDEELRIDYDPGGRLVRHENVALGGTHRALD